MNDAFERLREAIRTGDQPRESDINILLDEVAAAREYGGSFITAHRRVMDATAEAGRLRDVNFNLSELVKTFNLGVDEPLWRRIANQRREIKAGWMWARIYQKLWRESNGTKGAEA